MKLGDLEFKPEDFFELQNKLGDISRAQFEDVYDMCASIANQLLREWLENAPVTEHEISIADLKAAADHLQKKLDYYDECRRESFGGDKTESEAVTHLRSQLRECEAALQQRIAAIQK